MNILTNKLLRIPLLSIAAGLIITLVDQFITIPMYREFRVDFLPILLGQMPEVQLQMHNEILARMALIWFVVAVVLFLIIAIFCLRDMTKREVAKSTAILVIYETIRFALQNIFISIGFSAGFRMVMRTLAFMPMRLYGAISSIGFILSINFDFFDLYLSFSRWPHHIFNFGNLIFFALPFLFVFFGKKEQNVFYSRYDWYLNIKQ